MQRLAIRLVFLMAMLGALAPTLFAQTDVNGPVALITTYHAKPEDRIRLRKIMQTDGVAQFNQWKKAGAFESYQLLFSTYAGAENPDMYLVVKFAHFRDLAAWQKIEETYPGGLPPSAQSIATPLTSGTADIVKEKSTTAPSANSQFFVLEYDVLVDTPKYTSYVLGYAVPQFEKWQEAGVLSSYECFTNQNPAGAPWGSFIVLEYKDLPSLAEREEVKTKARVELGATNPSWKKWSDDKTAVRKEKAALPVRMLN